MNDKEIKRILKSEIIVPKGYINAINTAFYKKNIKKVNILKIIISTLSGIFIGTSVVIAGYNIYQNIWKEPEQVSIDNVNINIDTKIENTSIITEEKAKNISIELIDKLGYENIEIKRLQLKDYNGKKTYDINLVSEEEFLIVIDAFTGHLIGINNLSQKISNVNEITQDKAEDDIKEICNIIGIDIDIYKLQYCKKEEKIIYNTNRLIWVASLNRIYDGIANPYDSVKIYFYESENMIKIDSITINEDRTYTNNEKIITKEKAEEIARKKENEISILEVEKIESSVEIRKMNTYIYKLENNISSENIDESNGENNIYKIEDITRNVWVVRIKHKGEKAFNNTLEYNKNMDKKYFIDITTGEIIGGEKFYEEIINPLYNT